MSKNNSAVSVGNHQPLNNPHGVKLTGRAAELECLLETYELLLGLSSLSDPDDLAEPVQATELLPDVMGLLKYLALPS
jgi:hypothetical protein